MTSWPERGFAKRAGLRMMSTLALVALTVPAAAQDARTFPILRAGQPAVCADLTEAPAEFQEGLRQWVIGFWSGMNVAERAKTGIVGHSTSATGIFGEVALFCRSHPAMAIDQATFAVREQMKRAGK